MCYYRERGTRWIAGWSGKDRSWWVSFAVTFVKDKCQVAWHSHLERHLASWRPRASSCRHTCIKVAHGGVAVVTPSWLQVAALSHSKWHPLLAKVASLVACHGDHKKSILSCLRGRSLCPSFQIFGLMATEDNSLVALMDSLDPGHVYWYWHDIEKSSKQHALIHWSELIESSIHTEFRFRSGCHNHFSFLFSMGITTPIGASKWSLSW